MKTDGHDFLEQLAAFPAKSFEGRFLKASTRLGLAGFFNSEELSVLYRAAFRTSLCNIAFNGLGGCENVILPEGEPNRRRLEYEFMKARQRFFASAGWKSLTAGKKERIRKSFLTVRVAEENLAPEP